MVPARGARTLPERDLTATDRTAVPRAAGSVRALIACGVRMRMIPFADADLPAYVQTVADAFVAAGATPLTVDPPVASDEVPHWRLVWSPASGRSYADVEVYVDGVEWFAQWCGRAPAGGAMTHADYGGSNEREAGPVPAGLLDWLRVLGSAGP